MEFASYWMKSLEGSVYTPKIGLDKGEKLRFWEALDEVVRGVPSSEKIVVAADFNGHIGSLPGGFNDVHSGFGFRERNDEGAALLDFARILVMDLGIKRDKKRRLEESRPRINWGGLTPITARVIEKKVAGMGVWQCRGDMDDIWDRVARCIKETASKVLGISRGQASHRQGDWWWDEEVKKKVEVKKRAYAKLVERKNE
ncbi:uncharacterized protein LOC107846396 [Capsicum annuum]|uniref:uncharacterized protein LOC107846396 n=1 Tax=Capsicum annuum TaxID=4072 RepID=UPI001FB15BBA|nr:uncharacterized protein LOC107846396 [Capsicum annuum]